MLEESQLVKEENLLLFELETEQIYQSIQDSWTVHTNPMKDGRT